MPDGDRLVPDHVRKFVAGGLAGCLAKSAVSPLDRIKILRQGEHSYYGNMSLLKTGSAIVRNEGFLQLWRGLPSLIVRIFPYAGVQFWGNDYYRRKWSKNGLTEWTQVGSLSVPVRNIACGSMAGVTALTITYPLDTIRTRILYTSRTDKQYKNWRSTFKTLLNSPGGVRNFYQGMKPALIGMVPYGGLSFGTFHTICEIALKSDIPLIVKKDSEGKKELNWYVHSVAGGAAGLIAQLVVFPVDTARRRMQNAQLVKSQNTLKDKFSVFETLRDLWCRSPNRFWKLSLIYRGFSLNLLRAIPAAMISYTMNERFRLLFNVHGGK